MEEESNINRIDFRFAFSIAILIGIFVFLGMATKAITDIAYQGRVVTVVTPTPFKACSNIHANTIH